MFLGVDLGTGSVKALLLDEKGRVLSEASEPYDVHADQLGWAETQPDDWWQATCKAVQSCCKDQQVKAIGLSGQMHGTVLCNANGEALRPAILWADTRSSAQLRHFHKLPAKQKASLANPIVTGMMGSSLLWLKENEFDMYQQARWAVQPKDWLRFKLTETLNTDPSDASATLLYDLQKDAWAFDIVQSLGLRTDFLAPIKSSSEVAGYLSKEAAEQLGLGVGIPVATGGADAACSAFGSDLRQEGQVQINMGTAMQIFAIRDTPQADTQLRTHLYRTVENNYYAMAAMGNAGIAFEWVRRILGVTWQDMYKEAFNKPAGSEGLLFLPYLTGERTPHLNPNAKGTWHGLTLKHERGHLIRAVFEGIAFALKDGLSALEETGVKATRLRLTGGGTQEAKWQQLLADVLQKPLYAAKVSSASAKGAALLAAKASGHIVKPSIQEPQLVAEPQANDELERGYLEFRDLYVRLYKEAEG